MGFTVYLVFLILTYLRPIEAFAPELESYRPMVWLSVLALLSGLIGASLARGGKRNDDRSGSANLNSALSGNSGHYVGSIECRRQGVFHEVDQEEYRRQAATPQAHA